jgi:hypothetical protein
VQGEAANEQDGKTLRPSFSTGRDGGLKSGGPASGSALTVEWKRCC